MTPSNAPRHSVLPRLLNDASASGSPGSAHGTPKRTYRASNVVRNSSAILRFIDDTDNNTILSVKRTSA